MQLMCAVEFVRLQSLGRWENHRSMRQGLEQAFTVDARTTHRTFRSKVVGRSDLSLSPELRGIFNRFNARIEFLPHKWSKS